jgi:hypothetical protein
MVLPHRDPVRRRRLQVDRGVHHARGDQQPQRRQLTKSRRVEEGPFPHRHDDVVRLEHADQRLGPLDVLGEHVDVGQRAHRGPVRTGQGNPLIVIQDRDPHGADTT